MVAVAVEVPVVQYDVRFLRGVGKLVGALPVQVAVFAACISFIGINMAQGAAGVVKHPAYKDGSPFTAVLAIPFAVFGFIGIWRAFFYPKLRSRNVNYFLT